MQGGNTSGAFTAILEEVFKPKDHGSADFSMIAEMNAARVSSIYGNSTTVQPPAIRLIPQVKY